MSIIVPKSFFYKNNKNTLIYRVLWNVCRCESVAISSFLDCSRCHTVNPFGDSIYERKNIQNKLIQKSGNPSSINKFVFIVFSLPSVKPIGCWKDESQNAKSYLSILTFIFSTNSCTNWPMAKCFSCFCINNSIIIKNACRERQALYGIRFRISFSCCS